MSFSENSPDSFLDLSTIIQEQQQQQENSVGLTGDVAIVGIGLRMPGGSKTPNEFWVQLLQSFDGVSLVSKERWAASFYENHIINNNYGGFLNMNEWKKFDPLFFGISPKEAPLIDPQQRMMLTLAWEALEDAQIPPFSLRGSKIGVFMGVSNYDYMKLQFKGAPSAELPPYTMTGTNGSIISNRISYCFDFRGPSITIDTACSSSLVSVNLGCQSILSGESEVALCGGVNALLDPSTSAAFSSLGVLNPDGHCRAFDADAKGYVRGEGAGIVVLKSLAAAERDGNRIYGVIRGGSTNEDGKFNKSSLTTPSISSQAENIRTTLNKAALNPSDIFYVEAHGTGTPVGDPIEVQALHEVFSANHSVGYPLKIGSVKSNIGHLESAAGIASLIKVCMMLKNRLLVPTINFNKPNPAIPFEDWNIDVVKQIEDFPEHSVRIGINSFGFGGSNCHLIIEEYQSISTDIENKQNDGFRYLVPLSANSQHSLNKYTEDIISNGDIHRNVDFKEFVMHQSLNKSHLSHRKVYFAKDWKEFIEQGVSVSSQLSASSTDNNDSSIDSVNSSKVVFVFCGQGPQWKGMGSELYQAESIYKETVDHIDSLFKPLFGYSILEKLISLPDDSLEIHHPIIAQPALFLLQCGLVSLYRQWGVEPSFVVGHSFGEVTSAYCSGALTLEEAVKIVYHRSSLQNITIGSGKMLAVTLTSDTFNADYHSKYPELEIACYNSLDSLVITGVEDKLQEFSNDLTALGIFNVFLKSPCSFHSSHQKVLKSRVFESLTDLPSVLHNKIPLFSTVTGSLQTDPVDARYIYRNLRHPVQFKGAIESIYDIASEPSDNLIFLEITPHPTLSYLINKIVPNANVIPSLYRNKDELVSFNTSIAILHCNGCNVNFTSQFSHQELSSPVWRERVNLLPRYQWDTDVYWNEPQYSIDCRLSGPSGTILGHQAIQGLQRYESIIDCNRRPFEYLKDHKVKGKALFPGAGYIDAIIQAMYPRQMDIMISSIEFQSPFFLVDGEQQYLETVFDEVTLNNNNSYKVQFFQKDGEKTQAWTKTANARLSLLQPTNDTTRVDIASLMSTCKFTTIGKTDLYQKISRLGLNYGPTFQRVESIDIGPDCSMANIPFHVKGGPHHILNACLIDNCFHGMLALLDNRQHFVVAQAENVHINLELLQHLNSQPVDNLYLYTKILHRGQFEITGSTQLLTPSGQNLLSMKRFTVKTLDKNHSDQIKFPCDNVFTMNWQTKESPLPSPFSIVPEKLPQQAAESQILMDFQFVLYCAKLVNQSLSKYLLGYNLLKFIATPIPELLTQYQIHSKFTRFLTRLQSILIDNRIDLDPNGELDADMSIQKAMILDRYPKALVEFELVERAANLIPALLTGDSSACHSLFENDLLSKFYTHSSSVTYYLEQLADTIQHAITSKLSEPRVFRILEIGGGTGSLTYRLLNTFNLILGGPKQRIEIEYTFTDVSAGFVTTMNEEIEKSAKLPHNFSMKFKTLDLERDVVAQGFLPGSYDMVLMSYVVHAVSNLPYALEQLNHITSPSGWLLFIEPSKNIIFSDIVFGCFHQWWQYSDNQRSDHCSLAPEQWSKLLHKEGFPQTITISPPNAMGQMGASHSFVVLSQKLPMNTEHLEDDIQKISLIVSKTQVHPTNPTRKLHKLLREASVSAHEVEIIESQNIETSMDRIKGSNYLFYFHGLETLSGNYKLVTQELVTLIQKLATIPVGSAPKLAIVTKNSCTLNSRNYLNASLIGIARTAANEYPTLSITMIDIDDEDTTDMKTLINLTGKSDKLADSEFIIKGGKILVPRLTPVPRDTLLESSGAYEKNINNVACLSDAKLGFHCVTRSPLGSSEIEISVKAVGLNFKDYLFMRGLLPQEIFRKGDIYNPPFGLECSGIISRIGEQVDQFSVGDEVVGFARHSLGSHVVTNQNLVVMKPSMLSYEEAASIPVVYCTAFYSLFNVAKLDTRHESVLIHGATGGVGMAALNLLKMKSALRVFATAGSTEKQELLKERFGEMLCGVYNSRTKEFADRIKETSSGVNVLLNTLSGEFMNANFESLASFGRIADLSVTHIYANEPLDMSNFKRDTSYSAVDLERLIDERPQLLQSMLSEIMDNISSGSLEIIPINVYSASKSRAAVESMSERKHIGKIVIDCKSIDKDILIPLFKSPTLVPIPNYKLDISNTVIITGQTGISLELIKWLANRSNASDIVVISRSSLGWKLETLIKRLQLNRSKPAIHHIQVDIANMDSLTSSVQKLEVPPIQAVFHLAAIYYDVPFDQVNIDVINKVHDPKVIGAINLHRLSIISGWKLDYFVLFSSITSITGYNGQASYNSSNAVLDALCNFRISAGLPSLSFNWGPLQSEGKVADNEAIEELFLNRGLPSLSLPRFFGALECALSGNESCHPPRQLIVSPINAQLYFDSFPHMRPKMAHLVVINENDNRLDNGKDDISLEERITNKVANLLSVNHSKLNPDTKLKEYGLDSLLTVQFKSWIDKEYEKNLFTHIQLSSSSIKNIIQKIANLATGTSKGTTTALLSASEDTSKAKFKVDVRTSPLPKLSYVLPRKSSVPNIELPSLLPITKEKSSLHNSTNNLPQYNKLQSSPVPSSKTNPLLRTVHAKSLINNGDRITSNTTGSNSSGRGTPLSSPTSSSPTRSLSPMLSLVMPTISNNINPYILGMGTAVPNGPLYQDDLGATMSKDFSDDPETVDKVVKIFEQSHIKTRHLFRNPLLPETSLKQRKNENISDVNGQFIKAAPSLSRESCEKAIKDWGGNVEDITHIVSVSSTGVVVPDINFLLIEKLGLNRDVERVSINFMGCLAGLSSLRAACSLACHNAKNRILVVCTEICSTHFTTNEGVDQIVASTIFADGSAAYILGCNPSIYERPLFEVLTSMNRSVPGTAHTMTWEISTNGWDLGLDQSIPHHIGGGIETFVRELLEKTKAQTHSTNFKDYEFLIHTGGKAILMSIENSLDIVSTQNSHSWSIYKAFGNMSSASVLFVMDHARKSKSLPQYSIGLAFGPGLAFEGCVLRNIC
ncbi:putative polyketide synthase [Heterostelium album PN500]|uniref:Putative polyketide synthase n=1 Tax=Heterostelium pallidum (strain ATCC 26659 / Pp 5 / PN500) TaxID=670386 RepID=D3B337_HETP5|nr:putative polyketide synthase [Heterostelium album PN500]EFA83735.1 putative polyketide synthase [Heterostelium album PN500]|eukprot:XP_020435852.1 putative polyketide synthase [Heterostelium album PN500]